MPFGPADFYYSPDDELAEDACSACDKMGCDYVDFLGMPWHATCFGFFG